MSGIEPEPGEAAGNKADMSLKELRVCVGGAGRPGSCGSPRRGTQLTPRAGEKGSGRLIRGVQKMKSWPHKRECGDGAGGDSVPERITASQRTKL